VKVFSVIVAISPKLSAHTMAVRLRPALMVMGMLMPVLVLVSVLMTMGPLLARAVMVGVLMSVGMFMRMGMHIAVVMVVLHCRTSF